MLLVMVLAVALLGPVAPQAKAPVAAPVLHGRCIWDEPGLASLPERCDLRQRAAQHAAHHGWRWDGADLVEPARAGRCPPWLLDELGAVLADDTGWGELDEHAALVLARNGRIDEVVERLSAQLARSHAEDEAFGSDRWKIARTGARVALDAGRPAAALELGAHWGASSWCGTCDMSNAWERSQLLARATLALDDDDAFVTHLLTKCWMPDYPGAIGAWIDLRFGPQHPTPPSGTRIARLGYELADEKLIDMVRRRRAAFADPLSAPLEDLRAAFAADAGRAVRALSSLSVAQRVELLARVEPAAEELERSSLVAVFADVGFPELGALLDRVPKTDRVGLASTRERWEAATAVYAELSKPR